MSKIFEKSELMDRASIQAVLDAYYDAFNSMDKPGVLSAFSKDAEFIDLTMGRNMRGLDELANFIDETWSLSPYFRLEPEEILIDGSHAAVRLIMSGAAKVTASGLPKPDDIWRIPSTSFFKLREHKIFWKADCWNMLAIPKQIGWLKTLPNLLKSNRRKRK